MLRPELGRRGLSTETAREHYLTLDTNSVRGLSPYLFLFRFRYRLGMGTPFETPFHICAAPILLIAY